MGVGGGGGGGYSQRLLCLNLSTVMVVLLLGLWLLLGCDNIAYPVKSLIILLLNSNNLMLLLGFVRESPKGIFVKISFTFF